ncbi:mCG148220 [Mus musculus]|nr:mCG148220 [Mus musculus]
MSCFLECFLNTLLSETFGDMNLVLIPKLLPFFYEISREPLHILKTLKLLNNIRNPHYLYPTMSQNN